jgi:hypothetical protein
MEKTSSCKLKSAFQTLPPLFVNVDPEPTGRLHRRAEALSASSASSAVNFEIARLR